MVHNPLTILKSKYFENQNIFLTDLARKPNLSKLIW